MGKIDTHHHYIPPTYRAYLEEMGFFGGQATPPWSRELSERTMDRLGVDSAIVSIARPGFYFGDARRAREMARNANEYAAELVRSAPERFGFFAALPLPSVDDAVAEVEHAYDVLGCDGIVLLANNEGVYAGDPSLDPILEAIDRRHGVLFIHPNALPAAPALEGVPVFVADFLLDTTRAALNIVRHGVLRRFGNIRIILSHGGGFLPYAAHRIAGLTPCAEDGPADRQEFLEDCRQFYFDTALTASPTSLPSLLAFAQPDRITYGSDFPYAPGDNAQYFTDQLDELTPAVRASVDRGAAEALFPRLSTVLP